MSTELKPYSPRELAELYAVSDLRKLTKNEQERVFATARLASASSSETGETPSREPSGEKGEWRKLWTALSEYIDRAGRSLILADKHLLQRINDQLFKYDGIEQRDSTSLRPPQPSEAIDAARSASHPTTEK